jgi:RNA polymerase sigma-70 factor, ECF subfamily
MAETRERELPVQVGMRSPSDRVAVLPAPVDFSAFGFGSPPSVVRHYAPEDESQLIDKAVAGDRLAARELYDTHAPVVFRLAFRVVGPDFAEECTQDTFVRAFQRLPMFRRESSLRTWLHSITVSVGLNLKRRERRRSNHMSLDVAPDLPSHAPESDPVLHERINGAIDSLPEELRTVVILHLVQGHSHPEIAEILDIPEGTSKARLSRARARLREELADVAA